MFIEAAVTSEKTRHRYECILTIFKKPVALYSEKQTKPTNRLCERVMKVMNIYKQLAYIVITDL
jgi:hypothetical protein